MSQAPPPGFTLRMPQKYALFDFEEDQSVEILQTDTIKDYDSYKLNNYEFDFEEEVMVQWLRNGEMNLYPAKVLKFADDYTELVQDRQHAESGDYHLIRQTPKSTGKGKRQKMKRKLPGESDDEENDPSYVEDQIEQTKAPKKQQKRNNGMSNAIADHLSQRVATAASTGNQTGLPEVTESLLLSPPPSLPSVSNHSASNSVHMSPSAPTQTYQPLANSGHTEAQLRKRIADLEAKLKKSEEENIHLRSMIVADLEGVIAKVKEGGAVIRTTPLPTIPSQPISIPNPFTQWGISDAQLQMLSPDPEKQVGEIMHLLWSRQYLAEHSLSGKPCPSSRQSNAKAAVTPEKVSCIRGYVTKKFANVAGIQRAVTRAASRTLNNASTAIRYHQRQQ